MEALRQIHIPHYKAILFRKTYPQLSEVIDRSRGLYKAICPAAKYNGSEHCWHFPSGAQIYFSSMNTPAKKIDQQGKAYDLIMFDELTHFTWEEYSYMFSRNRPTGPGTRVYMRSATNPGNVGHGWVKSRFIDAAPPMTTIWDQRQVPDGNGGTKIMSRSRIFIPATIFDNQELLKNDEGYLASLAMLPEAEKAALLYGSWSSFSGQVFREWRDDPNHYEDHQWTHVIAPFKIPKNEGKIIRCFDWGYSRPFSTIWIYITASKMKYVIREYYGCTGEPNKGLQIHHMDVAKHIREIEDTDENLKGRKITGVADPAIFAEESGVSIANDMMKAPYYISFQRGDHNRLPGKMQVHYHLAFNEDDGYPMLQVFNTCKNFIRTIPTLTYDEADVEDVDSDCEDHTYDALRYGLQANKIAPRGSKVLPDYNDLFDPLNQRTHDDVKIFRHF